MFVASLTIPVESSARGRAPLRPGAMIPAPDAPGPLALAVLGWLAFGGLVMALVPHSLSGMELGATLPFWLVGAPLIDLAWLMRRRAAGALARGLRRASLRPRQRCGARRLPAMSPRVAASRQARRSNIT